MPNVIIDESTNRLLQDLALPGESMGTAVRRVIESLESEHLTPPSTWLANTIAVWLDFEGLRSADGPQRLAAHILSKWEMARRTPDRVSTP